jgi:hypothetical protein
LVKYFLNFDPKLSCFYLERHSQDSWVHFHEMMKQLIFNGHLCQILPNLDLVFVLVGQLSQLCQDARLCLFDLSSLEIDRGNRSFYSSCSSSWSQNCCLWTVNLLHYVCWNRAYSYYFWVNASRVVVDAVWFCCSMKIGSQTRLLWCYLRARFKREVAWNGSSGLLLSIPLKSTLVIGQARAARYLQPGLLSGPSHQVLTLIS